MTTNPHSPRFERIAQPLNGIKKRVRLEKNIVALAQAPRWLKTEWFMRWTLNVAQENDTPRNDWRRQETTGHNMGCISRWFAAV